MMAMLGMLDMAIWEIEIKIIPDVGKSKFKLIRENLLLFDKN